MRLRAGISINETLSIPGSYSSSSNSGSSACAASRTSFAAPKLMTMAKSAVPDSRGGSGGVPVTIFQVAVAKAAMAGIRMSPPAPFLARKV